MSIRGLIASCCLRPGQVLHNDSQTNHITGDRKRLYPPGNRRPRARPLPGQGWKPRLILPVRSLPGQKPFRRGRRLPCPQPWLPPSHQVAHRFPWKTLESPRPVPNSEFPGGRDLDGSHSLGAASRSEEDHGRHLLNLEIFRGGKSIISPKHFIP